MSKTKIIPIYDCGGPGTLYLYTQLINMKIYLGFVLLTLCADPALSQQATQPPAQQGQQPPAPAQQSTQPPTHQGTQTPTIRQMKEELEKSPNPVLYAKEILKKRFKIDTITVTKTRSFSSLADSLAYTGTVKRVYGPYGPKSAQFLVQLLSKAPNQFYHISQIFIDTSIFRRRVADSIATLILRKLKDGTATFSELATAYSMGGEGATKGDLGWIARGALNPQIEHEIIAHKKGDVFKTWSRAGLHIICKTDDPRQDTGFALMMQVFL
jgi:hypothetical protein